VKLQWIIVWILISPSVPRRINIGEAQRYFFRKFTSFLCSRRLKPRDRRLSPRRRTLSPPPRHLDSYSDRVRYHSPVAKYALISYCQHSYNDSQSTYPARESVSHVCNSLIIYAHITDSFFSISHIPLSLFDHRRCRTATSSTHQMNGTGNHPS